MSSNSEGLTINLDIEEAIQHGNLTVHYQPIFDIRTLNPILVEAEALVRWDHPDLGLLSPTDFDIWQQSNRITTKLTDYVLQCVAEQQFAWKKQNITLPVAVNLSVAMISDNEFPKRLAVLLDQYNVDHGLLILDLAEYVSRIPSESTMQIVGHLRQDGFPIVLGNFGRNPVFLSELHRLSLTGLKIDAGQIIDLGDLEGIGLSARGIIQLAHDLNLSTYAKNVETQQSLSILKDLGCDKAQGLYLGKPMPLRQLTRLLVDQASKPDQPETAADAELEAFT